MVRVCGLARGNTVRARNFGRDFLAGIEATTARSRVHRA
ncbi:MAG: YbjQ family protein [Myxococcales bacterium]|nr:YbjQ family protein [Myxococcales bacterium]